MSFSEQSDPSGMKWVALTLVLLLVGAGGVVVAEGMSSQDAYSVPAGAQQIKREVNGQTQTGYIETVTVDGKVKRLIHWRTRAGDTVVETVTGPTHYQTLAGDLVTIPGPTQTVVHTQTTTTPGQTVTTPGQTITTPGETVTNTVTETVNNTVTEVQTVTETQTQTVTETVTVSAPPGPPGP